MVNHKLRYALREAAAGTTTFGSNTWKEDRASTSICAAGEKYPIFNKFRDEILANIEIQSYVVWKQLTNTNLGSQCLLAVREVDS